MLCGAKETADESRKQTDELEDYRGLSQVPCQHPSPNQNLKSVTSLPWNAARSTAFLSIITYSYY